MQTTLRDSTNPSTLVEWPSSGWSAWSDALVHHHQTSSAGLIAAGLNPIASPNGTTINWLNPYNNNNNTATNIAALESANFAHLSQNGGHKGFDLKPNAKSRKDGPNATATPKRQTTHHSGAPRGQCECPNCTQLAASGTNHLSQPVPIPILSGAVVEKTPVGHPKPRQIHSCHIPGCGKVYGKTSHLKVPTATEFPM